MYTVNRRRDTSRRTICWRRRRWARDCMTAVVTESGHIVQHKDSTWASNRHLNATSEQTSDYVRRIARKKTFTVERGESVRSQPDLSRMTLTRLASVTHTDPDILSAIALSACSTLYTASLGYSCIIARPRL